MICFKNKEHLLIALRESIYHLQVNERDNLDPHHINLRDKDYDEIAEEMMLSRIMEKK